MSASERPRDALLVLACVELLAFGLFAGGLGLYLDDWRHLEVARSGQGLFGVLAALFRIGVAVRPLDALLFLAYPAAGTAPLPYHLIQFACVVLEAWCFYGFIREATGSPGLARTSAGLALLVPTHPAAHLWFTNAAQPAALALGFCALRAALRAARTPGRRATAAAAAWMALSMLTYESAAFLPALLLPVLRRRSWAGAVRALAPLALGGGLAATWQLTGSAWLLGLGNPKTLELTPVAFGAVYAAAFRASTSGLAQLIGRSGLEAWASAGTFALAAWAVASIALARLLRPEPRPRADPAALSLAAELGAVALAASYLPFAVSGAYAPQLFGVMSRVNAGGALGLGLLLATGFAHAGRFAPRAARAGLAAALGAFLWTDWYAGAQWTRSWSLQLDILAKAAPKVAKIQGPARVLLADAPAFTGGVEVFTTHWDFGPALRSAAGRSDLEGSVVWRDGRTPSLLPTYLYAYQSDRLEPWREPVGREAMVLERR